MIYRDLCYYFSSVSSPARAAGPEKWQELQKNFCFYGFATVQWPLSGSLRPTKSLRGWDFLVTSTSATCPACRSGPTMLGEPRLRAEMMVSLRRSRLKELEDEGRGGF